jgi:hypothetical protein
LDELGMLVFFLELSASPSAFLFFLPASSVAFWM